jgi:hypothetical protein
MLIVFVGVHDLLRADYGDSVDALAHSLRCKAAKLREAAALTFIARGGLHVLELRMLPPIREGDDGIRVQYVLKYDIAVY